MKLMSDTNVHLENKKESRVFFVFLWIMYSTVYMTKQCFSGALAAIVDEGILTLSQTTMISAAFYIAYAPLQILGGIFADKYSPERLITIGLVGGAISNTVIFFNQNYYVMLISWIFNAIIQFALWPSVFKIMSSQLVRSDRGRMVFLMSLSSSGGLALSFIVSALLTDWRYNFLISAIALLVSAILLQGFCMHLDPILKKDREPVIISDNTQKENKFSKLSTAKLFLVSGFVAFLPAVFLRAIVENASKTLSPTMLMQSYEGISPSVGNLLNILIILAGLVGTLIAKFVLFPRIIKNEMMGILLMLLIAFPFTVVLRFVGNIPLSLSIISLSAISMTLTATHLLNQFFCMNFIPFGKNGTAAGIINSAASFGLVVMNLLFGTVAEKFGWNVATTIWIIMIAVSIVFTAIALKKSKKFKAELAQNNK